MANASQGIYFPLPQSISDSDSEKEIHTGSLHLNYSNKKLQNGIHNSSDTNQFSNGFIMVDHMPHILNAKRGFVGMTFVRKCSFLFSIAACFLTVIIFLWVLLCSEIGTCPAKVTNWENEHEDLEFKGRINIVEGAFKNSHNLALLFKRSLGLSDIKGGAISILGNNGAVAWYVQHIKPLSNLNCYLIDTNADGNDDCLLLGEMGLEVLDPVSGEMIWHMHNQDLCDHNMTNLDFPITLPDLNEDGIYELITVINGKIYHNRLLIICGKTGLMLSTIELKQCLEVSITKYEEDHLIYLCKNQAVSKYFQVTLANLQSRVKDPSVEVSSVPVTDNYSSSKVKYELNNHRLLINNTGKCPNCQSHISLYDMENDKQLWFYFLTNSCAMIPTSFIFKSTDSNLSHKGDINGFILKIWQWIQDEPRKNIQLRNLESDEISDIDSMTQFNSISERVILITFNNTNVHVINASETEITQLCFLIEEKYVCQPDLMNQAESLLISDLDNDGSHELVSYSSTFVRKKNNWRLVSKIKVLGLQAELPKLYEVTK